MSIHASPFDVGVEPTERRRTWTRSFRYDGWILGDAAELPGTVLAKIAVPTLVIDSTASPNWLRAAAEAAASAVPGGTHRSLDGSFHDVPPDVLAPVLKEFFLNKS